MTHITLLPQKSPGLIIGAIGWVLIGVLAGGILLVGAVYHTFWVVCAHGIDAYHFSAKRVRKTQQTEWFSHKEFSHKEECHPSVSELVEKANAGEAHTQEEIQLFRELCQGGLIVWDESDKKFKRAAIFGESFSEEKPPQRHLRSVG